MSKLLLILLAWMQYSQGAKIVCTCETTEVTTSSILPIPVPMPSNGSAQASMTPVASTGSGGSVTPSNGTVAGLPLVPSNGTVSTPPNSSTLGIVAPASTNYTYVPYKGVSFYGLETNLRNTVCSWKHPAEYYINKLQGLGFNTLRVPISMQYISEANFKILDSVFEVCNKVSMRVFLDFHRVSSTYQETAWDKSTFMTGRDELLNLMLTVLSKYAPQKMLVGCNSWNEYAGEDVAFKKDWDKFVFTQIENTFPGRFVYVSTGLRWGNTVANYSLEDLPFASRILYGLHLYPFTAAGREDWNKSFGNFTGAKVLIDEYGFRNPEDLAWGKKFVTFLQEKDIRNSIFWTVAHSHDTGGLWLDDCETFDQTKFDVIKPLLGTESSVASSKPSIRRLSRDIVRLAPYQKDSL